jgi:natural product precursor
MKKKMKKLVLAKETIRSMEEGELERIAGGTDNCSVSCNLACDILTISHFWC